MTGSCGPKASAGCCAKADDAEAVVESVREYYGSVLKTSDDLKTSACTSSCKPAKAVQQAIARVPDEILSKFYGCGAPLPQGIRGLRVLDLGSGSGRDAYVAAAFVGEKGSVTGLDTTKEQLEVANRHVEDYTKELGYAMANLHFVEGRMEDLGKAGMKDGSVDLVISNCVINLSPDKAQVLAEAFRVLAEGGEMHFSDVYANARLSEEVRQHKVLWGEGIAGALWVKDFQDLAAAAGFAPPLVLAQSPVEVLDLELKAVVGETRFSSLTYRLFKLPAAKEGAGQDGASARYKGSVPGQEDTYQLDESTRLPAGAYIRVSAPVAAILRGSWLSRHFDVKEGAPAAAEEPVAGKQNGASSCCKAKSACC